MVYIIIRESESRVLLDALMVLVGFLLVAQLALAWRRTAAFRLAFLGDGGR